MHTFETTVTIARPGGEVFAFMADPRNILRWNYAIARTVPTSPGPAGAGATYRQTRTIPPQRGEPPDHRLPAAHPPGRPGTGGWAVTRADRQIR
jgi:Polyketide cyclase / dehydrase and lipid transport